MASRSPELQAEFAAMDRIERAMKALSDLPEAAQARVRRWVAETYPSPDGLPVATGRPVKDQPQA